MDKYALHPDEVLVTPSEVYRPIKPLYGEGSGRRGGGRESIHKRKHTPLIGYMSSENCPLCLHGMKLWHMWQAYLAGGDDSHLWEEYWHGGYDIDRLVVERIFEGADMTSKDWDRLDGLD